MLITGRDVGASDAPELAPAHLALIAVHRKIVEDELPPAALASISTSTGPAAAPDQDQDAAGGRHQERAEAGDAAEAVGEEKEFTGGSVGSPDVANGGGNGNHANGDAPDGGVEAATNFAGGQVADRMTAFPALNTTATARLLIDASQSGALIGRGGEIAKGFREQTGCLVRILPPEELPIGVSPVDRVVQIVGPYAQTVVALGLVAKQLRSNPPKDRGLGSGGRSLDRSSSSDVPSATASFRTPYGHSHPYGLPPPYAGHYGPYGLPAYPMPPGVFVPGVLHTPAPPLCVQVSLAASLIGSVIGKGGQNISSIRQLSGARVKVHELVQGVSERIVEISGTPDQVQTAQGLVHAYAAAAVRPEAGAEGISADGAGGSPSGVGVAPFVSPFASPPGGPCPAPAAPPPFVHGPPM